MVVYIGQAPNGEPIQFREDAAASFVRIAAQLGKMPPVNRTTVSYAIQSALRKLYLAGKYPNFVADPDLSKHVADNKVNGGNAWDTELYKINKQILIDNGWDDEDASEGWHWVYYKEKDKYLHSNPLINRGEDNMARNTGVTWRGSNGKHYLKIFNTVSGFQVNMESGNNKPFDGSFTTALAQAFDTPSWTTLSESAVTEIGIALDKVLLSKS